MSIEKFFDIPLVAALALKEKQIQQIYRPIIAVHKWFARRPGTLFRGLILAEFGQRPLKEIFFEPNDFPDRLVVDPFMGGGTPIVEANRVGCDVAGFDINPMAAWIVREEIEHLDIDEYDRATFRLLKSLESQIGDLYRTKCPLYGDDDVPVKYFLWVKILDCVKCGRDFDLFPGYLVADDTRHPRNVLVCHSCGELNETSTVTKPGKCKSCKSTLQLDGPAKRGRCSCRHCGEPNKYPRSTAEPFRHRLFAIEYFNPSRKEGHVGRFFKKPDQFDLAKIDKVKKIRENSRLKFVPPDKIKAGDESSRLIRWGYKRYRELFNDRQQIGLEQSCRLIAAVRDTRVRNALATNFSDLLRYQNLLCRYDTMALKSLDIFSVHGFPIGLVQCESNILGITNENGTNVGSGGWINIIDKYRKAKKYCDAPFEIKRDGKRKIVVPIVGEWIGEHRADSRSRNVSIRCLSSAEMSTPPSSVDAVFTDPPYFGNVQYAELMDFCYVWLRRLVGKDFEGFSQDSTRSPDELTGNDTESRDLAHFTEGLTAVYKTMALALKPGGPLVFTFHHNQITAYCSIAVALLDAGFLCTVAIPCPAEMGGSIHIHGTNSSIVDTVFVCRQRTISQPLPDSISPEQLVKLLRNEIEMLSSAGMQPSLGDIRCVLFGHLTRIAILLLHRTWDMKAEILEKLALIQCTIDDFVSVPELITELTPPPQSRKKREVTLSLFAEEAANAISL